MFYKPLLILIFVQTCVTKKLHERKNQADTRWSWGYVDEEQSKSRVQLEELRSTTTTTEFVPDYVYEDPCDPYDPQVPDFSAPGRRISRVKCYEYIWDIKYQETKRDRARRCRSQQEARKHYEEFLENLRRENNGVLPDQWSYMPPPQPNFAFGARPTVAGEFPHMAGIGWKSSTGNDWVFKCGGSLISRKFVLTAAHCTKVSRRDTSVDDPRPQIVRLGDIYIINSPSISNNPLDANIRRIIKHPCYKAPMKYYDVALLELEQEITTFKKELQPACIWGDYDTSSLGTKATLTGWGVTETDRTNISPTLLAADVEVIEPGLCDRLLRTHRNRNWRGVKEHQICGANLTGGVDACQGDSGGPLQMKIKLPETEVNMYHIIGIVSFGIDCGRPNTPGIYTRVSSFVDWIENIVWPQDNTESSSLTTQCPR